MGDFPPSGGSGRQVPPRRRQPPVRGQLRGQQTRGWKLPMDSRARALSPGRTALAGSLADRKGLEQRGHVERRGDSSSAVLMVGLVFRQCER